MSGHILVVDGELSMCEMLQEGLSQQGFTVKSATNPTAALDLVREHDFDVVLTHVKLGDHDGIALCAQPVRARPDALVAGMTAFGSMESAVGAIRAGAYDFISKPIQLESLALSMQRAVQHRRLREEVKRPRDSSATAPSKAPG